MGVHHCCSGGINHQTFASYSKWSVWLSWETRCPTSLLCSRDSRIKTIAEGRLHTGAGICHSSSSPASNPSGPRVAFIPPTWRKRYEHFQGASPHNHINKIMAASDDWLPCTPNTILLTRVHFKFPLMPHPWPSFNNHSPREVHFRLIYPWGRRHLFPPVFKSWSALADHGTEPGGTKLHCFYLQTSPHFPVERMWWAETLPSSNCVAP